MATLIRAVLLDVDGVLTDGRIFVMPDGELLRAYDAKDGMAIRQATLEGLAVLVVTGNPRTALIERFEKLGASPSLAEVKDKLTAARETLAGAGIGLGEAAFMGDDVCDVGLMRSVGLAGCPSDATPEAINAADFVSVAPGGQGAVKEFLDEVRRRNEEAGGG